MLPAADLSVTKSADTTTVTVGQTVTYRVTVRNAGPNTATGVAVTDPLPAGLTFVSATPSAGSYNPVTGQWSVGTLAVGASATLTLRAKATTTGPVTNTATTHANEIDLRPGNNTDTVTVCVKPAPICRPCPPPSGSGGPCEPCPPPAIGPA